MRLEKRFGDRASSVGDGSRMPKQRITTNTHTHTVIGVNLELNAGNSERSGLAD